MILTEQDIIKILKDKPNNAILTTAQKQAKKLSQHITGINSGDLLTKISGLENEEQLRLRREYARSNKDMFARIHRPEDKVFSAKGGSTVYKLPEAQQKDFIAKLQDVYNGFSLRAWTKEIAKQYFHIDPMGLIFMEVSMNETYPTYKSTSYIYDYKLKGRDVEYVVFTTDNPKQYRVVDDMFDYLVEWDNMTLITVKDKTYPNYYGYVPAKIISTLIGNNTEFYTSPDWEIIELADECLRETSVKSIYKLKHGFPKAWQYYGVCGTCKGTTFVEGKECPTCNGSGKAVSRDASEVISIPIPLEGQSPITPDVAGYVSPDIEGWTKMGEENTLLENMMHSTYWGIKDRIKSVGIGSEKTATEIIDDMQPLHDRLYSFSNWGQDIETFVTNCMGQFYYNSSYKGCSIAYGKRYALESPDAIWDKYQNARKNGSPISVLDEHLMEYYYSKYDNNSVELNKYLKLMKVEPFIHLTIQEAKNVVSTPEEYNKKLYYSEWLNQLSDNEVLVKKVPDLQMSLSEYVTGKNIPIEKEPINIK